MAGVASTGGGLGFGGADESSGATGTIAGGGGAGGVAAAVGIGAGAGEAAGDATAGVTALAFGSLGDACSFAVVADSVALPAAGSPGRARGSGARAGSVERLAMSKGASAGGSLAARPGRGVNSPGGTMRAPIRG